jgi:hypothetical protein
MKYREIVAVTSSVLLAGHGAIAAPLPEMAGVESLTPIARERRYIVHSDELLSALLASEAMLRERRKPTSPIVLDHRYNFIHSNPEYAHNR